MATKTPLDFPETNKEPIFLDVQSLFLSKSPRKRFRSNNLDDESKRLLKSRSKTLGKFLDLGDGLEQEEATSFCLRKKLFELTPENKAHKLKQIPFLRPRPRILYRGEAAKTEKLFSELANQWRRETGHMSIMSDMILHPAYQRIIGMGIDVVPLILRELSQEPGHWFWALKSITGANPVKPEDKGRVKKMAEAWLDWGRQHGYKC